MPYGPHCFWAGGMWIFPLGMFVLMLVLCLVVFRRGCCGPWWHSHGHEEQEKHQETPLEILKRRYAQGEITKEQFEQMKKDIQQ